MGMCRSRAALITLSRVASKASACSDTRSTMPFCRSMTNRAWVMTNSLNLSVLLLLDQSGFGLDDLGELGRQGDVQVGHLRLGHGGFLTLEEEDLTLRDTQLIVRKILEHRVERGVGSVGVAQHLVRRLFKELVGEDPTRGG